MIKIIIPSAGRASTVLTNIETAVLYVPESEAEAYRQHTDREIITHADDAYKNLAAKRQSIYQQFGDVFMLDDDIDQIISHVREGSAKETYLSPAEAFDLIQTTAENARAAGCYLFGFNNSKNPRHYTTLKPIVLNTYINASAFGMLKNSKLYFSDKTTAAESHWLNLLNAFQHRKSWCDQRFCFNQKKGSTFYRPGGQTAHRTIESERFDSLFLRRLFGTAVRVKKGKKNAPLLHRYQRDIKIPL